LIGTVLSILGAIASAGAQIYGALANKNAPAPTPDVNK